MFTWKQNNKLIIFKRNENCLWEFRDEQRFVITGNVLLIWFYLFESERNQANINKLMLNTTNDALFKIINIEKKRRINKQVTMKNWNIKTKL